MKYPELSVKSLVVILLSLLSMGLVMVAWNVYSKFMLENQERAVGEQVARESTLLLKNVESIAEYVGMYTQHQPAFRRAFHNRNASALTAALDEQFHQYQVSIGNLKLVQSYVYDAKFQLLASSSQRMVGSEVGSTLCYDAIEIAAKREAGDQLKILSGICRLESGRYSTMILPVGGLRHEGYLQLVYDPYYALLSLEKNLAKPLAITTVKEEVIYRSPFWRVTDNNHEVVVAGVWLRDINGVPVSEVQIQQDLRDLMGRSVDARNRLLLFAGGFTLLVLVLALWALQVSMIKPIRELINQLNLVRQGRHHLSSPLSLTGNAEVRELVQVFNNMSADLARLYDEYEEAAFIDQLTSLPNRTLFLDRLRQMILTSERKGERFGIMLLDLDGFKEINDALGHQVGDKLLQKIAQRLKRTIRASSTIARAVNEPIGDEYTSEAVRFSELTLARLGGDEFAILLPSLKDVDGAISVAKRIASALEPHAEIDGNSIVVAGTLGIAMFPEHGEDAEELLRRADIAMYVAKHIQSDFSVYDVAYDTHSVKQLALKAELRSAIEEDQMVLFYQPKLDFKSGYVSSVEALVRWKHPTRGMIPPDQFIPLSEQRGLIGPLTEWVIQKALWQYNQWQSQGIHLQIAVNLSSRVLFDLSLPNKIERLLIEAKLPASVLSFEITEEATMIDPSRAMDIMNRLNEMGLVLSIDDFGTGYSSLGYLKKLPVAEIKIDRSFVMDMETSESDAKIVHATIDLAHNLGLKVVAEGIETEYALNLLRSLNCDYAQGYYLSHPIPAAELVTWLAESAWGCKPE